MAASSTRPEECYADYPSPNNYPMQDLHEILCAGSTVDDSEEHIISEKLARAVMAQEEFALVGNESVPNNEAPFVIVDGGATTTLTSSFENCTGIKPKNVNINLAEGGIAMVTTHVCLKKNYFRSRTGEIRAVTTQAFVVPSLRTDQSSHLTSKVIVSCITPIPRNQDYSR
jgi:hypothetical protein